MASREHAAFIGFTLSPEMRAAFSAAVEAQDRTKAATLRRLVREYLDREGNARLPRPSASEVPVSGERDGKA
jgi:hypothetical protein